MAQICPAKSTIVPFKKQMYSSGSIILSYKDDKCICVSIHAPTRGATGHDALYVWCRLVSIHAPTRVRLDTTTYFNQSKRFQSTHPRGVRRKFRMLMIGLLRFQSTHPRGVRLEAAYSNINAKYVSIHAPTRGATVRAARGSDHMMFQSTHPRGVRPEILHYLFVRPLFQSTHPRGVRRQKRKVVSLSYSFNPRTHEGCDRIFCKIQNINIQK